MDDDYADRTLFELQDLDLEVERLGKDIRALQTRLTEIDAAVGAARRTLSTREAEVKALALKAREAEGAIDDLKRKQEAAEGRMLRVTNEKQAEALRHEMTTLEGGVAEHELALLEIYEAQEAALAAHETARAELAAGEAAAAEERRTVEATVMGHEARIIALKQERPHRMKAVLEPVLARYERLHVKLGGKVALETDDMSCPGCGMAVRRADLDKMKAHRDNFVDCPTCGRMLRYVGV